MNRTALCFLLPIFGALPALAQSVPGYAIPNSKHYRESGVGNATGRAGSAHLTARALLDADGNTTIELTTGDLDSPATPPGSFRKVQFKPLNGEGDPLLTQSFTPLATPTGYYAFSSPSLGRQQQTQLQANITGIDNRTDVVTLIETVKLRPDLAVHNFHVPVSAIVNTPVTIPANIVELNGDASATTTCELLIDGAVADKASNVYVDAGGSVSCEFSYSFNTTGNHTIEVRASNVAPADWDSSNNSASANIDVIFPNTNTAEHGRAGFTDENGGFPLSQTGSRQTFQDGVLIDSFSTTIANIGQQQDSSILLYSNGCGSNAAPYQFPVDVTYSETMDGVQAYSVKATGITSWTTTTPVNTTLCGSTAVSYVQQMGSAFADDYSIHVISNVYYDAANKPVLAYQQVDSTRNAGDVTYFSSGYQCVTYGACSDPTTYYTYNNKTPKVLGTLIPIGSTWTPSITATDASGAGFGGSVAVSLTTSQVTVGKPNRCSTRGPDQSGLAVQTCSSSQTDYTKTEGSVDY